MMMAVFIMTSTASAQACLDETSLSPVLDKLQNEKAAIRWPQLLQLESCHAGLFVFDQLLGKTAQELGDSPRASMAFDRMVRLNPYNAEAWVDLVLALASSGDQSAAWQAHRQASLLLGASPGAKKLLTDLARQLGNADQIETINEKRQSQFSFMVQYESNANSGLQQREIDIYLDGQAGQLLLADDYQRRGDWSQLLAVQTQWQPLADYPLQGMAWARLQRYQTLSRQDNQQIGISFARASDNRNVIWISTAQLDNGLISGRYATLKSQWKAPYWLSSLCELEPALEMLYRQGSKIAVLNTREIAVEETLSCYLSNQWQGRLQLQQRYIQARKKQAGGNATQSDLQLDVSKSHQKQLISFFGRYQLKRDEDIYSPLFGDVRRQTVKSQFGLQWQSQIDRHWQTRSTVQYQHTAANLALFRQKGWSVGVELQYAP